MTLINIGKDRNDMRGGRTGLTLGRRICEIIVLPKGKDNNDI
jgi:hypothetical protein